MSRGWAKASACRLQTTLSCAFLCHIVSLQYLSRSSLHRLAGLPCRLFLSYGLQLVTREVHRSSLRRLICPAQDHFIFLTVLIISMTFVLSLTQMLVFLSSKKERIVLLYIKETIPAHEVVTLGSRLRRRHMLILVVCPCLNITNKNNENYLPLQEK